MPGEPPPLKPCPIGGIEYGPPYSLSAKQTAFLQEDCREALYGGAAGGGKTDALMRAALQYICVPGYAAVLVRQTYPQLIMEGGFIERALEWFSGTPAVWHGGDKRWTFPNGASITFMHMERDDDRFKVQGAEFQYIGFDELTNWRSDKVYRFSAARLRRPKAQERLAACPHCGRTLADVPLRIRGGTNPGSRGESWVQARFVQPWAEFNAGDGPPPQDQRFLPALLTDNPGLDSDEYLRSLDVLDQQSKAQLRDGTWGLRTNVLLQRNWFPIVDDWPRNGAQLVRGWDFAATDADEGGDPDWTVGALQALVDGQWFLIDVQRARVGPAGVESLFMQTLAADVERYGRIDTVIEREPGSSGKMTVAHFQRMAAGFSVYGQPPLGSKTERARPLMAAAQNGNFSLVRGAWNEAWLDEAALFPDGEHDDQVDAATGGMAWLTEQRGRGGLRYRP